MDIHEHGTPAYHMEFGMGHDLHDSPASPRREAPGSAPGIVRRGGDECIAT